MSIRRFVPHGCPNILVRSDLPPSLDRDPYDPEYLGWVTLHELGDPVLSQRDVNALALVFAWALEGVEPYPPAEGP